MRGKWFFALLIFVTLPAAADCEGGHWIKKVTAEGQIVILEDGSIWEVDSTDKVTSHLWLPMSNILVCDEKLVNTDDGETVEATRVNN